MSKRTALVLLLSACGGGAAKPDAMPVAPYNETVFDNVRISSNGSDANFQRAQATIDLHDGPFASVTLVVNLTSACYPFTKWQADPPPTGQNWPADCDAFDRNFEFTLDEPGADTTKPPAIELVRAITPFGGPEQINVDLTDLANGLPGPHTIDVFIPTYSDGAGQVSGSAGGWNVSALLQVTPGAAPHKVLAVIPLVNGSQAAGMTPPVASFTVPAGTTSTRLEYRVTGHGGANDPSPACIGPAEEFCKRTHHVTVDGTELATLMPWRMDCDTLCTPMMFNGVTYCLENPCGNMDSVRAPRANWCPGSVTPPFTWDADALHVAGDHTFTYAIDNEFAGGTWRVSAVFFAFGDLPNGLLTGA